MNKLAPLLVVTLAIVAIPPAAQAEDVEPNGEPTRFYGFVGIGSFNGPERVGGLTNGSDGLLLTAGFGRRFNPYVAGEAEASFTGQTYNAPGYTGDGEPTVSLASLGCSLKLTLPRKSFRPFVTAGVAYFQADIQLVEEDGWGYAVDRIEDDSGFGTRYGFGVDVIAGKHSWIGFEYRDLQAEAEFGTSSTVDLGGSSLSFSYRHDFGAPLGKPR
jgi:opacity protein-like surface antigen